MLTTCATSYTRSKDLLKALDADTSLAIDDQTDIVNATEALRKALAVIGE